MFIKNLVFSVRIFKQSNEEMQTNNNDHFNLNISHQAEMIKDNV